MDSFVQCNLHSSAQVCLAFNGQSTLVATGSMDNTAKLWDVQKGHEVATLHVSCFFVTLSFAVLFSFFTGVASSCHSITQIL